MRKFLFNFKVVTALAVICCAIWISGTTVYAQNVSDEEPNNNKETAQLIQANSETPEQALTGNRPNQYLVEGFTDSNDEDWFKVYLTRGTQYVICNGKGFDFEIYDSGSEPFYRDSYSKVGLGSSAFPFFASEDGYYYVKVRGNLSTPQSYILGVGGPTYTVESCEVNLGSVSMSGSRDTTVSIDLRNYSEIPEGALVYAISFSKVGSTSVDSISVRNLTTSNTINLANYTWSKNGLVSLEMPLNSRWQVTFGYSKNTSFTPVANFQFVYPVTNHYVDEINITL